MGAMLIALQRKSLDLERLREIMRGTLRISSMVFLILIGASIFSLVFRGYGGDDAVRGILESLPGGGSLYGDWVVAGTVVIVSGSTELETEPARCVVKRQQLKAAHSEHRAAAFGENHLGESFAAGHFVTTLHRCSHSLRARHARPLLA